MRFPASTLDVLRPAGVPAGWAAFALVLVAALAHGGGAMTPWLTRFLLLCAAAWLAGAAFAAARRWLHWPLSGPSVGSLWLAGCTLAGIGAALAIAGTELLAGRAPQSFAFDMAVAAAFAGLLTSPAVWTRLVTERRRQHDAARHREALEREQLTRERAQMELAALQAQIEPHFLYNTLANVQHLVRKAPAQADEMLGSLIDYLKTSLPRIRGGESTLGEELARVEAYLAIMRVRMGTRLRYEIDVPEAARVRSLPPLSVMTLVENAVKHGLEPKPEGGSIRIAARDAAGRWEVEVSDDGLGFGHEAVGGIGLANLRDRLRTLHGGAARLDLEPRTPSGVDARLTLPLP